MVPRVGAILRLEVDEGPLAIEQHLLGVLLLEERGGSQPHLHRDVGGRWLVVEIELHLRGLGSLEQRVHPGLGGHLVDVVEVVD